MGKYLVFICKIFQLPILNNNLFQTFRNTDTALLNLRVWPNLQIIKNNPRLLNVFRDKLRFTIQHNIFRQKVVSKFLSLMTLIVFIVNWGFDFNSIPYYRLLTLVTNFRRCTNELQYIFLQGTWWREAAFASLGMVRWHKCLSAGVHFIVDSGNLF